MKANRQAVYKIVKKGKTRLVTREAGEEPPPLWADKTGKLNVEGIGSPTGGEAPKNGQGEPKGLSSPLLPPLPVKKPRKTSTSQSSRSSYSWQSLKSLDIVSFNQGAESTFVLWLARKIEEAEFEAVSLGWVLSNAAFELDVSIETIKRYLAKHTADLAEFHSDGKIVTLRRRK